MFRWYNGTHMRRINLTQWQFDYAIADMDIRRKNVARLEEYFVGGKEIPQIAKESQVTPAAIRQAAARFEEQLHEKLQAEDKTMVTVFLDNEKLASLREDEEGALETL